MPSIFGYLVKGQTHSIHLINVKQIRKGPSSIYWNMTKWWQEPRSNILCQWDIRVPLSLFYVWLIEGFCQSYPQQSVIRKALKHRNISQSGGQSCGDLKANNRLLCFQIGTLSGWFWMNCLLTNFQQRRWPLLPEIKKLVLYEPYDILIVPRTRKTIHVFPLSIYYFVKNVYFFFQRRSVSFLR